MPSKDNRYKKKTLQPNMSDNSFHNHSITERLFNYIRKTLPEESTILELGSGWGTGQLAKYYKVYSVEHDLEFLDLYDSVYFHVLLKDHKKLKNHLTTLWYDAKVLKECIKDLKYNLLLVDGPPQTRSGFYKYHDIFDIDAIWVFDDMHREIDKRVVNSTASKLECPYIVYCSDDGKPFAVINDPILKEST